MLRTWSIRLSCGALFCVAVMLALGTDAEAQLKAAKAGSDTGRSDTGKSSPDAADIGRPGDVVSFTSANRSYPTGAIIVVNNQRRLYYVLGDGRAIRYPIAVGSEDNLWTGKSFVQAKLKDPEWVPPWDPESKVAPGPSNPLGPRALYLGWTLYRIHGTNSPGSIGSAASSGCFRMYNHHVKDLYERVHIGAPVFVVESL